MDGYIQNLRLKYYHPDPKKPQESLHTHRPITYRAKKQMALQEDMIPKLYDKVIKQVQVIVGGLLFVGRLVNNK